MCIPGNHMSHAPLGVLDIPLVTGNNVNMDMENALSGCLTDINPDIVAIRVKFRVNALFFLANQLHTGRYLVRRQVEKAGDMPLRDDQGMPRTDRIGVAGAISKFVIQRNATWVFAEQARVIGVSLLFWFYIRH